MKISNNPMLDGNLHVTEASRKVSCTILGPTPISTAEELADAVFARVPGARLTFQVNYRLSALIEAICGKGLYEDRRARDKWGWKHRFDLRGIIDNFNTT